MNRLRLPYLFGLLLTLLLTSRAVAQLSPTAAGPYTQFGNQFIQLWMVTDPPDGSFFIQSGSAVRDINNNPVRYLFGNYGFMTSNVVFRIDNQFGTFFYSNHPVGDPFPPKVSNSGPVVPYRAYDSIRIAPDTLELYYFDLGGIDVIERWVAERPSTIYDGGTDLLLEFTARPRPNTPGAKFGVFLMLDDFNSDAAGNGGAGDKSSILTSSGYYPVGFPGRLFNGTSAADTIPTFYHVGNFTTEQPLNNILPVHRLKGKSHAGVPLDPPKVFAVGDWRNHFRDLSWDIAGSDITSNMSDCATAMRWENIPLGKTIRTAFGTDDKPGNNLFHCRDSLIFIDIKTERVVEQKQLNGNYTPQSFDVEMWITSLSSFENQDLQISIEQPLQSNRGPNRLTLDASTAATQNAFLGPFQTKILRWRLNFNPIYTDDSAHVTPMFRYRRTTGASRRFFALCNPTITIRKYGTPPPPVDTMAPQIVRGVPTRGSTITFPYTTFDRHLGYRYDTGLDKVVIERNDNNNFTLTPPIGAADRCDTTKTVALTAQVVDTTKSGYIVFAVYDCNGNISRDSAIYDPRPDIFPPQLLGTDSLGTAGPPCNTREFTLRFIDSLNQTPTAGDNGFGSIAFVTPPTNFYPLLINPERGGSPINTFDRRASARLTVIDTMKNASARVQAVDYAGNADTFDINYCTLPDTAAPRVTITPKPSKVWTINASDTLPWDRGLESVVVLANPGNNMQVALPTITPGDRTAQWDINVIDDALDAEVTLEIRDVIYATNPAGHADTITIRAPAAPDTMAPIITFDPVPGSNRARANVIVADTHYINGVWYRYDVGLGSITVAAASPNIRLATPPVFSPGDSITSFSIEVVDTLVLNTLDSICIEAVDVAGNRSVNCYYYPITPDRLAPEFVGTLDLGAAELSANATDQRPYDRGMGELQYNPTVNSGSPVSVQAIDGQRQLVLRVPVTDPTRAVAGEFVVTDAIGRQGIDPDAITVHTVRLPFRQPAVHLKVALPGAVEPGAEFDASIIATDTVEGALVDSVRFTATVTGSATFVVGNPGAANVSATQSGSALAVVLRLDPTKSIPPGDTLAKLHFRSIGASAIGQVLWQVDPITADANGGVGRIVSAAAKAGDTAMPRLALPPIYVKVTADSLIYVNGECERILSTTGRSGKLALLGIAPQPLNTAAGSAFQIDMTGLPATGGVLELIDANGATVAQSPVSPGNVSLRRELLQVPSGIAPGAYVVRLRVEGGAVWIRAAVVR